MELEKMFKIKLICYNHSISVMGFRKMVSSGDWSYCKKTDSIPTNLMDDAIANFKGEPSTELADSQEITEALLSKVREKRDFYKVLSTLSGKPPEEKDAALMLLEEIEWEIQNINYADII
jgi:hypothetical protein